MTSPTVRPIRDDELKTFIATARVAMHGPPPSDEIVEARVKAWELDRCHAAFDGDGKLCGSARAFSTELTVPGGATVPAAAVTSVGVLPTHRRQGHLRRMMLEQLADVAARGEPAAVLVAAEYPIYGRFGYGLATQANVLDLDADVAVGGWRDGPTGTIELVDNDTFESEVQELYGRARLRVAGHIAYPGEYWEVTLGAKSWMPGDDHEKRRNAPKVLWRDAAGQLQGAAMYTIKDNWVHNRPRNDLESEFVIAATDEAEREIVRFLTEVDWVGHVRLWLRPIDDPLPLWLHDGRRVHPVDLSDHVWTRVLDVPAALTARRYSTTGRLVLEVVDPLGFADGRFALDAAPDGAECRPARDEPDLVVPAAALGAAYLGGQSWARLAAAGWADERRPGALQQASALFTTPRAPWCAMTF